MDILIKKSDVRDCRSIKMLALSKICEVLRLIGLLMNQISIDNATINELKQCCTLYFNLFSLFFNQSCNSTVWTLRYVVPYHASILYERYLVGYGTLSMQGKEAKHSSIKQELKCGTNRSKEAGEKGKWHQLFRSTYVRNFYLPYHFPLDTYKPHFASRNPPIQDQDICNCFRTITDFEAIQCDICTQSFDIIECGKNGQLNNDLYELIFPIKCNECSLRFPDNEALLSHVSVHENNFTPNNERMPLNMTIAELRIELGMRNALQTGSKANLIKRLESLICLE